MRRLPVVVESQPTVTTGAGQTTILDGRPTVVDNANMAELSNATADVSDVWHNKADIMEIQLYTHLRTV